MSGSARRCSNGVGDARDPPAVQGARSPRGQRTVAVFRMEFYYQVALTWARVTGSEAVPHTRLHARLEQPPADPHTDAETDFPVPYA